MKTWILPDRGYFSKTGWVEPGKPFELDDNEQPPSGSVDAETGLRAPKPTPEGPSTMSEIATAGKKSAADRDQGNPPKAPEPPKTDKK